MAGATRLELATSAVTGQRSNQLSYAPAISGFQQRCYFSATPGQFKMHCLENAAGG